MKTNIGMSATTHGRVTKNMPEAHLPGQN